tara:strand:- start:86 stop:655 length:570 start_codon:yes stop_codon:yes gene_type:complete
MFRTVLSFLVLLALSPFANAEAPSQSNWASGLDRYIGHFRMIGDDGNPIREFESHWAEQNKIFQYASFSMIDGPTSSSRGVGFCFWNEKEKRPEFNELEFRDGERFVYEGYCVDMTKTTMTWIVTEWSKEGVLSQVKMTDTHNADGLDRSTEQIVGTEDDANVVKWIRVTKENREDHPPYPESPDHSGR